MRHQITIALILLLIISISPFAFSAVSTGKFQIGNEAPSATSFAVQDSASTWDSSPRTTHDILTNFRWQVADPNNDQVKTRICISDDIAYQANPCLDPVPILDYTTALIAPGTATYELVSSLPYPACGASDTYYISLTPNDAQVDGTAIVSTFVIINSVPSQPSSLIMTPENTPATSPRSTHSQSPSFSWSYSDDDTQNNQDNWPADTLTNSILVGDTCGTSNYLLGTNPAGQQVANQILWGVIGAIEPRKAITPFCVRLITTDNAGCQASLDTNFELIDNIPDPEPTNPTTHAYLSEDLGDMRTCYASGQPSPCYIFLSEGQYQTVNLRAEFTELDSDCSSDNAQIVLRYPSQGANYPAKDFIYPLTYVSGTSDCVFTGLFSDTQGIEFFRQTPATDYNLELTLTSQAGSLTPGIFGWDIVELPYIKIADTLTNVEDGVIDLGDPLTCTSGEDVTGYGADGISLGKWNPGLCLEKVTNWGNQLLTLEWAATDPRNVPSYTCLATAPDCCSGSTSGCWDLNPATGGTDDLQIDDDNSVTTEASPLTPANIPEEGATPIAFNPASGLQVCNAMTCDSAALDETLDTYYHINPPTGLLPGDYETTLTIGLI